MKFSTPVTTSALALLVPLLAPDLAHANPRKSNTMLPLPRHTAIGDVDGDGLQDMVQFAGPRVFAYRTNDTRDGILHGYLDVDVARLVLGDFTTSGREHGRDQVCAVHTDGTFRCYSSSDDRRELWWWFTQPNFLAADEHAIVGDFDGDGADDILKYRPSTGALELWTRKPGHLDFKPLPTFALGNLAGIDRKNKVLLAGDFGQAAGRDDLLVWDPAAGTIARYDAATDADGKHTFWWAFTTKTGYLSAGRYVRVANFSGGQRDGLALTDGLGGYQFFQAEYLGGGLVPQSGVDRGNLTSQKNLLPYFGRFAAWPGEPGTNRDDVFLYNTSTNAIARVDARYDAARKLQTYWWAYTQSAPDNDAGWPALRRDKWRALKCKLSDVATALPDAYYADLVSASGRGKRGMFDFMRESSYGTVELQTDIPAGTRTIAVKLGSDLANKRWNLSEECRKAWNVSLDGYRGLIAFINGPTDLGAAGDRVTLTNTVNNQNVTAHEMGHVYGLPHSFDDSTFRAADWATVGEYHDGWDVMGSEAFLGYSGAFGKTGTDFHAYNKKRLGWLPAHRIGVLNNGAQQRTDTVTLAFVDRPEANGYLLVEVPIADGRRVLLEAREPRDWDRNTGPAAVYVRRTMEHPAPDNTTEVTELQTDGGSPARVAGASWSGFGVTVKVKTIDVARGTATVEVTH